MFGNGQEHGERMFCDHAIVVVGIENDQVLSLEDLLVIQGNTCERDNDVGEGLHRVQDLLGDPETDKARGLVDSSLPLFICSLGLKDELHVRAELGEELPTGVLDEDVLVDIHQHALGNIVWNQKALGQKVRLSSRGKLRWHLGQKKPRVCLTTGPLQLGHARRSGMSIKILVF